MLRLSPQALREAQEEVAIPPQAVEAIGVSPPVDSASVSGHPAVGIMPAKPPRRAPVKTKCLVVFEMPLAQALQTGRYHPLDAASYRRVPAPRMALPV